MKGCTQISKHTLNLLACLAFLDNIKKNIYILRILDSSDVNALYIRYIVVILMLYIRSVYIRSAYIRSAYIRSVCIIAIL